jgi:hypothetical protein
MYRMNRRSGIVLLLLGFLFLSTSAESCGTDKPTAEKKERDTRITNYERLVDGQPAETMRYSPSRETINFWIKTWGQKPGKLAYVYMQAANGQLTGYYVLKGLPVSYCAAITSPVEVKDYGTEGHVPVPAPGMDAVYYSGGQCNSYYGRDATTNSYIEYTVGDGQNVLLYERPLPRQDVEPLGFTQIKDVQH